MDQETKDTIQLTATEAVGIANTVLPFLKQVIPALAALGGPIGLGISAAQALIPLIQRIPTGEVISKDQQQAQLDYLNGITAHGFSGPEWQKSTATPPAEGA